MDSITAIQNAIEYMEQHLLEEINYQDVARQVNLSGYHFHRLFSMITGMTTTEYIRNRRLSQAGQELILSDEKVIDISLKYGYDSPESFSKAFSRFHGIAPSAARRSGTQLTLFNRLILKLIIEGGVLMEYKIVEKEPFKLITKTRQFRNEIVNDESNHEIPDFWDESIEAGLMPALKKLAASPDLYGACATPSKESETFDYGIGVLYDDKPVPEGYQLWEITHPLWGVFPCYGTDAQCIKETWQKIFGEFLPGSGYDMLDLPDFELYPGVKEREDLFCEIWIPIGKKG